MQPFDTKTYTAQGVTVRIEYHYDSDSDAPWKGSDGHGPVRCARIHHMRPGERIMHADGRDYWLYDWQAACKTARADGWGAPNGIERAVQADFDYLRGYLRQDWYYVGIVAPLLQYSVPPGGLVIDCFAGSGTTGAVARKTGRRAILIEKRESQCIEIVRRLSQGDLLVA